MCQQQAKALAGKFSIILLLTLLTTTVLSIAPGLSSEYTEAGRLARSGSKQEC